MRSFAAVAVAGVAAAAVLRRVTHRWGATPAEHAATLPGDELIGDPAIVATRAMSIEATPETVWSWLIQIGQDRGGMYSYDRLENLIGLDIHSAEEIDAKWQSLAVGDRVVLVPKGWAGVESGYSLPVEVLDAPRTLVLRQSPPEHPWDAVWTFHLQPRDDGGTRLISRSRSRRHSGLRGLVDLALDTLTDPITWLMTSEMLRGIKRRAEGGDLDSAPKRRCARPVVRAR